MGQNATKEIAPIFQVMHYGSGSFRAEGEYECVRGKGLINYLFWLGVGVEPTEAPSKFTLYIDRSGPEEIWSRSFSGKIFRTKVEIKDDSMMERRGPIRFYFRMVSNDEQGLAYELESFRIFGIPIPKLIRLAPTATCRQTAEGTWNFEVELRSPFGGQIVRYKGVSRMIPSE